MYKFYNIGIRSKKRISQNRLRWMQLDGKFKEIRYFDADSDVWTIDIINAKLIQKWIN
jgi:hypothetical protein